jgi:hypothetical protein
MPSRVTTAVLCDFAQVRDGLLCVLSGGVTRIVRREMPAPMGVMLAISFEVPFHERDLVHELAVVVRDPSNEEIVSVRAGANIRSAPIAEPGEGLHCPVVLDLRLAGVLRHGLHDVMIRVDDEPGSSLAFWVVPQLPGPAGG